MSMSINGPMSNCACGWPQQGARTIAAKLNHADNKLPQIEKKAELPENNDGEFSTHRSQQHLESVAERLATQTEAVAARFKETSARWSERFASLEARALESGNHLGAERIADIGENVTERLDGFSEKIVSQLDGLSERISSLLSESYGVIGEDVSTTEDPAVEEVV